MKPSRKLTYVRADLTAWHTDLIMDEGRHRHTWAVYAYFDGSVFRDARSLMASLVTILQNWQGKDLPPELWAAEDHDPETFYSDWEAPQ